MSVLILTWNLMAYQSHNLKFVYGSGIFPITWDNSIFEFDYMDIFRGPPPLFITQFGTLNGLSKRSLYRKPMRRLVRRCSGRVL